jgi:hypothetical protein
MDNQKKSLRFVWVLLGIVLFIALLILGLFYFARKNPAAAARITQALPFGRLGPALTRTLTGGITGETILTGATTTPNSIPDEPLLHQLTTEPIAGYTTVSYDGKSYVRYVLRANGHIHDIDPVTGIDRELTNTTIPRVHEAFFGQNGNIVVLRYIRDGALSADNVIVTLLGSVVLPADPAGIGSIKNSAEKLPDNISAVSISPDGTKLFYLIPVLDGVSGTIVSLGDGPFPKEVFRNAFHEWLPQLLANGKILLTTKPSAQIPGYSYMYDPGNKTLARILREKKGLTTLGNGVGSQVLFGENLDGNIHVELYDEHGYVRDEGERSNTVPLPIATLPEKCAWSTHHHTILCGTFMAPEGAQIPDAWYQGQMNFSDSIWSVDTETTEIALIATPRTLVQKDIDVTVPLVDNTDTHFFFINKRDGTLWATRLMLQEASVVDESGTSTPLTPFEEKDAAGSQ